MSSARKPLLIGGIPSTKKFLIGISGVPEIFDFPGHQKPPESEATEIMPPL
jgi:hypothetical protein